jgi:hypothetical protein
MIDVHELLSTKENDVIRVRKEIEALRLVASMLSDSEAPVSQTNFSSAETRLPVQSDMTQENPSQSESLNDETMSEAILPKRSLRDWFSRAAGE